MSNSEKKTIKRTYVMRLKLRDFIKRIRKLQGRGYVCLGRVKVDMLGFTQRMAMLEEIDEMDLEEFEHAMGLGDRLIYTRWFEGRVEDLTAIPSEIKNDWKNAKWVLWNGFTRPSERCRVKEIKDEGEDDY